MYWLHNLNKLSTTNNSQIISNYLKEVNFEKSKKQYLWATKIDNIENEFNNMKSCSWCNPFDHKLRFS